MHFTGEITLGSLLTIVTLITIAIGIGKRIGSFEQIVTHHATTLTEHSARFDSYERQMLEFVGHLQRVVGRVEVLADRRGRSRDA